MFDVVMCIQHTFVSKVLLQIAGCHSALELRSRLAGGVNTLPTTQDSVGNMNIKLEQDAAIGNNRCEVVKRNM